MNIDALKKELKSFSKQKLIEEYKDLYLAHDTLKQTSIALNKQLDQANERLKYAIVPKFKIGQKLFRINYDYESNEYDVSEFNISNYVIFYNDKLWGYPKGYLLDDEDLFATKEEADKKLQELRGGE